MLLPRVCLLLSWLERVFPDLKLSALKVCVKAVVKSRPFDGPGFPSSKPLWSPHQMYKPSAPHIWNWAVFVECFTLMCVTAHSSWEDWKMWFGNVWQGLQECWGKREMTYCMWVCTCVCIKTQLVEGFVYVPKWGIQYNVRDSFTYYTWGWETQLPQPNLCRCRSRILQLIRKLGDDDHTLPAGANHKERSNWVKKKKKKTPVLLHRAASMEKSTSVLK